MGPMTRTEIPFTLGDALARARKRAGLDQEAVAEAVGVSRPLVSRWENSKSVPDVLQFRAIAEVTGADWLLDLRTLAELDTRTVGETWDEPPLPLLMVAA